MATRGLAYAQYSSWSAVGAYKSLPITDFSFNVARNPISEKAMNVAGEPKIYGGTYGVTGSLSAAYRPAEFATIITDGLMCKGTGGASAAGIGDFAEATSGYKCFFDLTCGDEFGNTSSFASCAFNSVELSLKAGEMGKVSFNWVGVRELASGGSITTPSYDGDIPIFYNAVLTFGSTLIKATGLTIKINRPLSADDFVLGTEYTQGIIQSDSCVVEGTINLSNKEYATLVSAATTGDTTNWATLNAAKTNTVAMGAMTLQFNNPAGSGTALGGIYIPNMMVSTVDVSVSGRQRFEKTLNFKCQTTSTAGISWNFTGTAPTV